MRLTGASPGDTASTRSACRHGGEDFPRNVVVEFPSLDQALACYNSKEYQEAWEYQKNAAVRGICVVEGA